MKISDLIYYEEMKPVVDYYMESQYYRGERFVPIKSLKSGEVRSDIPIILGRNGHYHHYDLEHLELLGRSGALPPPDQTTLVLYDWHEDLDHDPAGTEIGNGTWAYLGLVGGLYQDIYIIGTNPRGFNELNKVAWDDGRIVETTEETMKLLNRVYLYPFAPTYMCLKLFKDCESYLKDNPSVDDYFIVDEGDFALVKLNKVYCANQASSSNIHLFIQTVAPC